MRLLSSPFGKSITRPAGQGIRSGSIYLTLALGIAGVLNYVFQGMSAHILGLARYGALATLWSATFLITQVLWIGTTQTLGRHVADREARGEGWQAVVASARRLQLMLLGGFLILALLTSPWITTRLFAGQVALTAALIATISFYAFSYFKRGLLSGHRQFSRLSGMFLVESLSRALVAAVLLIGGAGVVGPAFAMVLAPVLSVVLIRVAPVASPKEEDSPFSMSNAFLFGMPVIASMACAQILANGGPIIISGFGGRQAHEQAGLLLAALTLTRIPQFVLSPVVSNLLPHLSRMAALEAPQRFNRFVLRAVAFIGSVGVGIVIGTWLLGSFAMQLLYGDEFVMSRELLTVLGALAAFYLLCELLNQVLFAKGLAPRAVAGWLLGIGVALLVLLVTEGDLLSRVSYALTLGQIVTAAVQGIFIVASANSGAVSTEKLPSAS